MPFGFDDAIAIGGGIYSAIKGNQQAKKGQQMQDKALGMAEQQYAERAPLRKLGMTQLGQIEAPMNLGNLGYNASNPFQKASGPAPSTASYGDWGKYTVSPEAVDSALNPAQPSALEQAKNDLRRRPLPVGLKEKIMRSWDAQVAAQPAQPRMTPLGRPNSGFGWEGGR